MSAKFKLLPILGSLLLMAGCVQMHPTRSGFLSDYREIVPLENEPDRRAKYVNQAELAGVDSFFIERVTWLADDLGQPSSSPENAAQVRRALETALIRELGTLRPVVSQPGPRTARIRAAVTGVQEARPLENLLVLVQVGPIFNGGAVVEIEMLGPNGYQIAAESMAWNGAFWDVLGYFHRTRHAEDCMARTAVQFCSDLKPVADAATPPTDPPTAAFVPPAQN